MSHILEEAIQNLKKIDEAITDTAPHWLRTRLQYSAPKLGPSTKRANPDIAKQNRASYGSRYRGEENLFKLLTNAGYDISQMDVITDKVPDTLDDPIFDSPDYLPVLHFVSMNDDKVWIPGINDQEAFTDDTGKDFKFKYMNNSKLRNFVKDFAKIDLNSDKTYIPQEKITNRSAGKSVAYSGQSINYGYNPDSSILAAGRRYRKGYDSSYDENRFDKSGYYRGSGVVNQDLRNKLQKYKAKLGPKKMLKLQDAVVDLQELVDEYMQQPSSKADFGSQLSDKINAKSGILNAYSHLIKEIIDLQDIVQRDIQWYDGEISNNTVNRIDNNFKDIKNFEDRLSSVKPAVFIW